MFKLMKIAVLSDIHGNMEAFREVVKYLEKEQIKVLILGDIIDYGPHSNEVITCLMDLPWEIIGNIRGNHEEAIIEQKYDMFSSERKKMCREYKIAECTKLALFEYHNGFNSINRGSYRRKKMLSSSWKP